MSKNNRQPLQFTKLTQDDITKHKDFYTYLLINDESISLREKGLELHEAM